MFNEKARAHIRLILPFWSQNFPLWFFMVWSAKKNMETICSVEPNQFPHKPMIVDQEASHHRRAHHTSQQHTLPHQTNDTLTIDMPYHTMPHQCHTMPCPSKPCNITLYKDQGASPTLFLLTRRVSLLPSLFMCHLLIYSPLKFLSLLV